MVKMEIKEEVEVLCRNIERALSLNDFEEARKQLSAAQKTLSEIHIDIENAEREYLEPERRIAIEINGMDKEEYKKLRGKLKRRTFALVSGIPSTIKIMDDEGTNIREQDGW